MNPDTLTLARDCCDRVFVRLLRECQDIDGDPEFDLSEGQATRLLHERTERALSNLIDDVLALISTRISKDPEDIDVNPNGTMKRLAEDVARLRSAK